jgi:uncharacterized protein involved in oxidation of intracellular sulfur
MGTVTMILQDPPYGTEKVWNALRVAQALTAVESRVNLFLLGDAVGVAKQGQDVPKGYYNLSEMLQHLIAKGAEVRACGTRCKARGLTTEDLASGISIGVMADLARWIKDSDQALTF